MAEYIDREAAIEAMYKEAEAHPGHTFWVTQFGELCNIPAADVRPVVRGKWQFHMFTATSWGYECRVCHTTWDTPTNYCPNCGADMREES